MQKRRRAAVLATAAVLCACGPVPAQARAERKPCPRVAAERSWFATLYTRAAGGDEFSRELVACERATRRRTVLARWEDHGSSTDQPAPQHWLSGRFAAVNQASCPGDPFSPDPCVGTLKVIDLQARRRHATVATDSPIFDMVLTRRGSVGMIHRGELITAVGTQVQVLDRTAEPYSLAYASGLGRLYWTGEAGPRSARLR